MTKMLCQLNFKKKKNCKKQEKEDGTNQVLLSRSRNTIEQFIKTSLLSKRSDSSKSSWEKVAVLLFVVGKTENQYFQPFHDGGLYHVHWSLYDLHIGIYRIGTSVMKESKQQTLTITRDVFQITLIIFPKYSILDVLEGIRL